MTKEPALRRVARAHADSQPKTGQADMLEGQTEDSVAWEHKSGGGVGSPLRSHTSEGFRSSWPPGCLVTVPNLSPSPPLLLSCHHPAQKSPEIHKVSQPGIWGLPQLTFLTFNFCSSTWILYPSQPGVLVSPWQARHFPILHLLVSFPGMPSSFLVISSLLANFQGPHHFSWSDFSLF